VAHDLNNILSGLVSYPELVLLELPENSPMRSKIETIQRSGRRAAAIVQDLLMIARRGAREHVPLRLNETLREYLESLEFSQMKKTHSNVRFDVHLADDVFPIKGSAIHLSKVAMNLVHNAAEAMPAGGTIRIRTRNRYIDKTLEGYERIPEGEYALLRVADEGIGIPEETLLRIFEPFYSKKRMERSGSGLGMTVVWNTVKDHAGFIDIHSQEGEGDPF
jgi:two-component system cell cycle sensor histidine kinase/response regulator CckA